MNSYDQRKYIIGGMFILIAVVFICRLFYVQIIDDSYKLSASNNVLRYVTNYPARSLIYDRNGKLLVHNEAAYDLMIIPRETSTFDTLELCSSIGITKEELVQNIKKAINYSMYKPSIIVSQISPQTYATLQERLYKFRGFYIQTRTLRRYTDTTAAHVLGYVGEVDEQKTKEDLYYKSGDYIGVSGIEKTYEKLIRGKKGVNIYMVDVHNRIKGNFAEGKFDTTAIVGPDINLTIDIILQAYGEKLMRHKKGSIVAIDPATGEILVIVSSPAYDPSLLIGRVRSKNYLALMADTLKPLFNRATMAKYPPGSTFKAVNALIGLQEGVIIPQTTFSCSMGYHFGTFKVGCHSHASPLDLVRAVQNSCNAYFCNTFRRIVDTRKYKKIADGYDNWRNHVLSFGIGDRLGTDLSGELKGNVPTTNFYNHYHGKGRWNSYSIISLAIGQGELGVTPLQMANLAATIANRGYYFIPHVLKEIKGQPLVDLKFLEKKYTSVDPKYFGPIVEGMYLAVNGEWGGTGRIARLDSISVCGKTGTAQNPRGKDHSIFMAFAPRENPKIAIAVYVENAGFGAEWAAPIASLIIEKYMTGKVTRTELEKQMMEGNLIGN